MLIDMLPRALRPPLFVYELRKLGWELPNDFAPYIARDVLKWLTPLLVLERATDEELQDAKLTRMRAEMGPAAFNESVARLVAELEEFLEECAGKGLGVD